MFPSTLRHGTALPNNLNQNCDFDEYTDDFNYDNHILRIMSMIITNDYEHDYAYDYDDASDNDDVHDYEDAY